MKRIIGIIILIAGFILIGVGILKIEKKTEIIPVKKEKIKIELTDQMKTFEREDFPLYQELKTKTYSFRSPEPYDLEVSFVANEESAEYYNSFLSKMYFNSPLKVEVGNFFNDSEDLLNYIKDMYNNPIYLRHSISSGKTKINNYDVQYFKVKNERKENVDIYEEIFYILISGHHNTKLMIKYIITDQRFSIDTLENLLTEIEIKKLDNIYLSKLVSGNYQGELIYDKANNPNKFKLSYTFKSNNMKEEINNLSSNYSLYLTNREDNSSVRVFLTDEDPKERINFEMLSIKNETKEEVSTYKDADIYRFSNNEGMESAIISKKVNEGMTYMVIFYNYKKITNEDIDNFLNIRIN